MYLQASDVKIRLMYARCLTYDIHIYDDCWTGGKMDRITIRLPRQQIEMLEKLVAAGEFPTLSEAVRYAVRELLSKHGDRVMRESDQIMSLKL